MKKIAIIPITTFAIVVLFTSCSHGIAKGYSDTDTIDTILVDTVEADSIIDDEKYGDIQYYEDEYLYFRYPSEYTCVQASDGSIVLFGDTLMHNFMVFDYGELLPNESSESVVKLMVVKELQEDPKAKLTYSSDIPVLPEYKDIQDQYVVVIKVQDEQNPAIKCISGVLLKNGHIHVSTFRADNQHDSNMFQAVLKTVVMR